MEQNAIGPVVGADGAGIRVTGACGCAQEIARPSLSVPGFSMPRDMVDINGPGDVNFTDPMWWKRNTDSGLAPIYVSAAGGSRDGKELAGYGFYWVCWKEGDEQGGSDAIAGSAAASAEDKKTKTPVVVWVNGGPGASSLLGMFAENGPALATKDGTGLVRNPYSWTRVAHVIYVDAPLGTGFSYSIPGREALAATTSMQYAQMVRQVLVHVAQRYRTRLGLLDVAAPAPLFITGESYGGKYVPAIVDALLDSDSGHRRGVHGSGGSGLALRPTGMLIVDGFMAPVATGESYAPYATWALKNGAFSSVPDSNSKKSKQRALMDVARVSSASFATGCARRRAPESGSRDAACRSKSSKCVAAACAAPLLGAPHSQLVELGAADPSVAAVGRMQLPSQLTVALAARAAQSRLHPSHTRLLGAALQQGGECASSTRCNGPAAAALSAAVAQAAALAASPAPENATQAAEQSCQQAMTSSLQPAILANINPYFIMGSATDSLSRVSSITKLLSSAEWRRILGLSELTKSLSGSSGGSLPTCYCGVSHVVTARFIDWAQDGSALIQAALNRGVRVQMWNGDCDLLVPWFGTAQVANCLPYMAQRAKFQTFGIGADNVVAAQHRDALSVLVFHNAGHEVPMYQPAAALGELARFLSQRASTRAMQTAPGVIRARYLGAKRAGGATSAARAGGCVSCLATMAPRMPTCTTRARTAVAVGALVAGLVGMLVFVIILYCTLSHAKQYAADRCAPN